MSDEPEAWEEADRYPLALEATMATAAASYGLLGAVRDGFPPDIDIAVNALCVALAAVLRIEDRSEDGQLLAAIEKWRDENNGRDEGRWRL